jgi:hypothetical protein
MQYFGGMPWGNQLARQWQLRDFINRPAPTAFDDAAREHSRIRTICVDRHRLGLSHHLRIGETV